MCKNPDFSYHDVRALFEAGFPKVFTPRGALPVPLAIGTHEPLFSEMKDTITDQEFRMFMNIWTGRPEYLLTLARGGARYAMDGSIQGEITEEERVFAEGRVYVYFLKRFRAKMEQENQFSASDNFLPVALRGNGAVARALRDAQKAPQELAEAEWRRGSKRRKRQRYRRNKAARRAAAEVLGGGH